MEMLREFEDRVVVPLVQGIGADAIRDDAPITMLNGGIAFLANNARDYEVLGQRIRWTPLTVVYCDAAGHIGEVFRYEAEATSSAQFRAAQIHDIFRLQRTSRGVEWVDVLSGRRWFELPRRRGADVMLNAWHIFRGGILPALYDGSWRFHDDDVERRLFQAAMLGRVVAAYGVT